MEVELKLNNKQQINSNFCNMLGKYVKLSAVKSILTFMSSQPVNRIHSLLSRHLLLTFMEIFRDYVPKKLFSPLNQQVKIVFLLLDCPTVAVSPMNLLSCSSPYCSCMGFQSPNIHTYNLLWADVMSKLFLTSWLHFLLKQHI